MKRKNELHTDVEELLEASVIEEASSKVWNQFESALHSLDEDSLQIFREFLSGSNLKTLGHAHNLTEDQARDWIDRIKRNVVHRLRSQCKVRH